MAGSVASSFLSISITCTIIATLAAEIMKWIALSLKLTPNATALRNCAPH